MRYSSKLLLTLLLCALFTIPSQAQAKTPKPAPEWEVSEWLNGEPVSLADLRGNVVIIHFFQLWCPGCKRFSLPLMQKWEERFADAVKAGKLEFISIHTVFEGHEFQQPERLREYITDKGIHHRVGVDRHRGENPIPITMQRYRTRGTPEMAIIDKEGNIRFQYFGSFQPTPVAKLIEQLLAN